MTLTGEQPEALVDVCLDGYTDEIRQSERVDTSRGGKYPPQVRHLEWLDAYFNLERRYTHRIARGQRHIHENTERRDTWSWKVKKK
jgi:hypothetical protein